MQTSPATQAAYRSSSTNHLRSFREFLPGKSDLLVLSHMDWNELGNEKKALMQMSWGHRVFFVEPPQYGSDKLHFETRLVEGAVQVITPQLPAGLTPSEVAFMLSVLSDELFEKRHIEHFVLWQTRQSGPFHQLSCELADRAEAVYSGTLREHPAPSLRLVETTATPARGRTLM